MAKLVEVILVFQEEKKTNTVTKDSELGKAKEIQF